MSQDRNNSDAKFERLEFLRHASTDPFPTFPPQDPFPQIPQQLIAGMFRTFSYPMVSFVIVTLVLVADSPAAEQDKVPEAILQATDMQLERLTSDQLSVMNDDQVASFYASRMSSAGLEPWCSLVDSDILSRRSAGDVLLRLLQQPPHQSIRPGVWDWLGNHPNFATSSPLMTYSMELYQQGDGNWRWEDRGAFAKYLAASAPPEAAKVVNELAAGGGPGVQFAKDRFDRRIKAGAGTQAVTTPQTLESPPAKLASKQQPAPAAKSSPPNRIDSIAISLSLIAVMITAGAGLLWLLLRRRS